MSVTEYRASFDAAIRFSNGGDLTAHGFRVDVPSPDVDEAEIAAVPRSVDDSYERRLRDRMPSG